METKIYTATLCDLNLMVLPLWAKLAALAATKKIIVYCIARVTINLPADFRFHTFFIDVRLSADLPATIKWTKLYWTSI